MTARTTTASLVAMLAAVGFTKPTINNNNELATNWPTCVKPTAVHELRTPTEESGTVVTPLPTQAGMVDNCNKFCFVQPGDPCYQIAQDQGISIPDFLKWNPGAGHDCLYLQAQTYACVSATD